VPKIKIEKMTQPVLIFMISTSARIFNSGLLRWELLPRFNGLTIQGFTVQRFNGSTVESSARNFCFDIFKPTDVYGFQTLNREPANHVPITFLQPLNREP
jgi:hypothetical protein